MESNYYAEQLAKIELGRMGYPAKIKIQKDAKSTHWLSLNDESASELVRWLNDNFNITK